MITFCIPESVVPVNDSLFREICKNNPTSRVERTKTGEIRIMAPTGGETGNRNFKIYYYFQLWNKAKNRGRFFDSSTAFKLPSTAIRSPDLAFVVHSRWANLSPSERQGFPPICPDFVLEIRSKTDSLSELQSKMEEWIKNGSRLAWLLDLDNLNFYIYRPEKPVELISGIDTLLNGESVLEGFSFSIAELLKEDE